MSAPIAKSEAPVRASRRKSRHRGGASSKPSLASLGADASLRQCESCRKRAARDELVQLSGRVGSGRHAYVCIRRACLLARLEDTTALAETAARRIGEMAGLARRAGTVAFGAGSLTREATPEGTTVLVACDAAQRTARGIGDIGLPVPHSSEELGHVVGHRPLAALLLRPSRHAQQAAYWQRVWYEARDSETEVGA